MTGWTRNKIESLKEEVSQCHCYSSDGRFHRILLEIEDSLDALDSYLARSEVSSLRELAKKEEEDLLPYAVHAWESLQEKVGRTKEIDMTSKEAMRPKLKLVDETDKKEDKGEDS